MILEVKNLSKSFGQLSVVKNLTFGVEGGEVFGIAGPNGAGKTTLFNLITGFYQGSGEIVFAGCSIAGLRPHQICHRGLVRTFQIPTLLSTMSLFENVRVGAHFGMLRSHDEKARIAKALDFIGLTRKENVLADNLDLFDKRMAMLATALATEPKLLMLDEPMAGLSPVEIKRSIELVKKINKKLGITIVIIEHLMKVLVEICNRLMILDEGEKISIGSPSEVAKDEKVIEVYLGADYARG